MFLPQGEWGGGSQRGESTGFVEKQQFLLIKQQLWLCFWAPIGLGVPPPLLFRDGESKKDQSPCSRPYVLVADGKSPSRICVHREPEPLQIRESKPLIYAEGVNASRICVHRDPAPLQISGSTNVHRHEIERKRER